MSFSEFFLRDKHDDCLELILSFLEAPDLGSIASTSQWLLEVVHHPKDDAGNRNDVVWEGAELALATKHRSGDRRPYGFPKDPGDEMTNAREHCRLFRIASNFCSDCENQLRADGVLSNHWATREEASAMKNGKDHEIFVRIVRVETDEVLCQGFCPFVQKMQCHDYFGIYLSSFVEFVHCPELLDEAEEFKIGMRFIAVAVHKRTHDTKCIFQSHQSPEDCFRRRNAGTQLYSVMSPSRNPEPDAMWRDSLKFSIIMSVDPPNSETGEQEIFSMLTRFSTIGFVGRTTARNPL